MTIILLTHDLGLAASAERVVRLNDGRVAGAIARSDDESVQSSADAQGRPA